MIFKKININPLTSPGEGVTVFTSPYLSAGFLASGEAKGLIKDYLILLFHNNIIKINFIFIINQFFYF